MTIEEALQRIPPEQAKLAARYVDKLWEAPNGCWIWCGARGAGQYGRCRLAGRTREAAHVSYALFVGALPEVARILHECGNRRCVNPLHLSVMVRVENPLRKKEGNP